MNTEIKRFCEYYNKKLKRDKAVKEHGVMPEALTRFTFRVNVEENEIGVHFVYPYNGTNILVLDDEDLEYLYNKYSKKILEEMKENIEQVKEDYKEYIK